MGLLNSTYSDAVESAAQDWAQKTAGRAVAKAPLGTEGDPMTGGIDLGNKPIRPSTFGEVNFSGREAPGMQNTLPGSWDVPPENTPAGGLKLAGPASAPTKLQDAGVAPLPAAGIQIGPAGGSLVDRENQPRVGWQGTPAPSPAQQADAFAKPAAAPGAAAGKVADVGKRGLLADTQAFVDQSAAAAGGPAVQSKYDAPGAGGQPGATMSMTKADGTQVFARGNKFVELSPMEQRDAAKFPNGVRGYINSKFNSDSVQTLTPHVYNPADDTAAASAAAATQAGVYTGNSLRGGVARQQGTGGLDIAALKSNTWNGNPLDAAAKAAKKQPTFDEFAATSAARSGPGGAGGIALRERGRQDKLDQQQAGIDLAGDQMAAYKTAQAQFQAGKGKEPARFTFKEEKLPGKDAGTVVTAFDNATGKPVEDAKQFDYPNDAWALYKQGLKDEKRNGFNDYVIHAFGDHYSGSAAGVLDKLYTAATGQKDTRMAPHRTGKIGDADLAKLNFTLPLAPQPGAAPDAATQQLYLSRAGGDQPKALDWLARSGFKVAGAGAAQAPAGSAALADAGQGGAGGIVLPGAAPAAKGAPAADAQPLVVAKKVAPAAAQPSAEDQQALAWAKANPKDQRAAKILQRLGA